MCHLITKTRKATPVRSGVCRWLAGNDQARDAILAGQSADLLIGKTADTLTRYVLVPMTDSKGLHSWHLVKMAPADDEGGLVVYYLSPDLTECDCPDMQHRHPDGGCKHLKSTRAAFAKICLPL